MAGDDREDSANNFTVDFLFPSKLYRDFILSNGNPSGIEIRQFAERLKIAPGTVVGRMQKEGRIPYTRYNDMKRRFEMID